MYVSSATFRHGKGDPLGLAGVFGILRYRKYDLTHMKSKPLIGVLDQDFATVSSDVYKQTVVVATVIKTGTDLERE